MSVQTVHETDIALLEERIEYAFEDRDLLLRALTHRSFTNETEGVDRDNQRLEFLGDAILGLVSAEALFRRFSEVNEGALSTCQAQIVCESGLHDVALSIGLGDFLRLGRGEEISGGREKPSLLADAWEAVIAAIYLDGGLGAVRDVILRLHRVAIDACEPQAPPEDHKSRLQHLVQSERGIRPDYEIIEERGPDHQVVFVAEVQIDGDALARGEGRSKKEAEQRAALGALEELDASAD